MSVIKHMIVFTSLGFGCASGQAGGFQLSSPTIAPDSTLNKAHVYKGYGCHGDNQSPALNWTAGPKGTQSYAITVFDPDAPTGSGWWHWVVYNIGAEVSALPAGAGEASGRYLGASARQGRNDFGDMAYGGACPPAGDHAHRYIFTVYALGVERLDVPAGTSAAKIGDMIRAHALAQASLTAHYGR